MYRLLKQQRIRKSKDFERFRCRDVCSSYEGVFILKVLDRGHVEKKDDNAVVLPRIGIITSKKIGMAVVRNRIRRVVREAFRKNPEVFYGRQNYLFIALKGIADHTNDNITKKLIKTAKKLNYGNQSNHFPHKLDIITDL